MNQMAINNPAHVDTHGPKTTGTTTKRCRKSRTQQKEEREQIKAMLASKMTPLEVQQKLGVSSIQLNARLSELLMEGFQMPELNHTTLHARSLPETIRNWLQAEQSSLVRCEARNDSVVLTVIND